MLSQSVKAFAILAPALSYASLVKRDLTPVASPAPGWSYFGCYTDVVSARKLDSSMNQDPNMTVEMCVSFCSTQNYTVAGLEFGQECYCGFNLKSGSTKSAESQCQTACAGSATEPCGGSARLSVYTNGSPGGTAKPAVNGYKYLGCYTDTTSNRALTYVAHNDSSSAVMTEELCTSLCSKAGYKYAGLEYGGECFCDNTLGSSANLVTGTPQDTGCDFLCRGDSTEWCGGKSRLTLYSNAATPPKENLNCPGFEGCTWNSVGDYAPISYSKSSSYPHSGSYYLYGYGRTCGSGCSSAQSACIETYPYVEPGSYKLSYYAGGQNNFYQDPRCAPHCAPPQYSVTVTAAINGTTYTGGPCESGCGYTDVAGDSIYGYYQFTIPYLASYETLRLCITWDGIRRPQDDTVWIDDVSLFGPY